MDKTYYIMAIPNTTQIIAILVFSLVAKLLKISFITRKIKKRCHNKKLKEIPYFKQNWLKRRFLVGARRVIEIEVIVLNVIEIISFFITIVLGIVSFFVSNNILAIVFKSFNILHVLLAMIICYILQPSWHYKDPMERGNKKRS